jgi:hypothetical protein
LINRNKRFNTLKTIEKLSLTIITNNLNNELLAVVDQLKVRAHGPWNLATDEDSTSRHKVRQALGVMSEIKQLLYRGIPGKGSQIQKRY